MRKLTSDETWDYTKRMWKWVAFQVNVLKDKRGVEELKGVWLRENEPEFIHMVSTCFFCEKRNGEGSCKTTCPGSLVEEGFDCCDLAYNYEEDPGAFYREILRLDAIRVAVPPEPVVVKHEWMHGDVFKYSSGAIMMVVILRDSQKAYCLRPERYCAAEKYHPGEAGDDSYLHKDVEFLFNIKGKLDKI